MATIETLISAEQFAQMPDPGQPTELVRGKTIMMNMPYARHGQVCSNVVQLLGAFAKQHNLGHVLSNDSGIITQRNPDTVRGADVAFYSYSKVPKGPLPATYLSVPPDLVVEVISPHDRWNNILAKTAEYLGVGVTTVCVLDPKNLTAHVYDADQPVELFTTDQELTLPALHQDFRIQVCRFFE